MSESIDVSALCLISLHVMYFTRFQCLGYVHFVGVFSSDVNKTFLSRPRQDFISRPRPNLFSYFCIKVSDHSFSVNINNNSKINKEYIHCNVYHFIIFILMTIGNIAIRLELTGLLLFLFY